MPRNVKGFTLVEILVTAIILSLAITGMLMSFVYTQVIIINNTHKVNASFIMNQEFEEVQRRSIPIEVENWINESYKRIYSLPASSAGLTNYKVTLKDLGDIVTYDAGTLKHVYAAVTLDGKRILEGEMLSSIQE